MLKEESVLAFISIGILATTTDGASIFWPEAVAVIAFAGAWLVKGRTFLGNTTRSTAV